MQSVRWGIIGTGSIARVFAADLALTDSGEVVAVGSRSRATADRVADDLGVAGRYDSPEALVAAPEVDAVYVATPHPMHHAHARLAIDAGKAVLVEKPFTMNAPEARDLARAARAAEVFLMEAMRTRFLPPVAQIRRLVADGTLGEIVSVNADHGAWFPEDAGSRLFAPNSAVARCSTSGSMRCRSPRWSWERPSGSSPSAIRRSPALMLRPRCSSATLMAPRQS